MHVYMNFDVFLYRSCILSVSLNQYQFTGEMKRIFGAGGKKEPPPNLSDAITKVEERTGSIDKKIGES